MTAQRVWDERFMEMAKLTASWSKDPSTKVGAVIVDDQNRIVSLGYNGFPRDVSDDESKLHDRQTKLEMTVHAETNAILFAQRNLAGCTLYVWPMPCCARCAGLVIQTGIERVVSTKANFRPEWQTSQNIADDMFKQALVETDYDF